MARQTGTVQDALRFVYTVERSDQGMLHVISSQLLKRRSQKYQVQATAVVMLLLTQRMRKSGLKEEDVSIDLSESELGTQYVQMRLSSAHHEQFAAAAAS